MSPNYARWALMALLATSVSAGSLRRSDYTYNGSPVYDGLPDGWSYSGCYTDSQGSRTLDAIQGDSDSMTIQDCISLCGDNGYQFAGTEYSSQCFCGSEIPDGVSQVDDGECNMGCSGDSTQGCGGPDRISIYNNPDIPSPQVVDSSNGYCYMDCYTDPISPRTLNDRVSVDGGDDEMTIDACTAACKQGGYKFAGVEYGGECYCGNTIQGGAQPADECSSVCNGDSSQLCGGAGRISLYSLCDDDSDVTTTTTTTTTTTSTTVSSTSSTTTTSTIKTTSTSTSASSSTVKTTSTSAVSSSTSTSKPASSTSTTSSVKPPCSTSKSTSSTTSSVSTSSAKSTFTSSFSSVKTTSSSPSSSSVKSTTSSTASSSSPAKTSSTTTSAKPCGQPTTTAKSTSTTTSTTSSVKTTSTTSSSSVKTTSSTTTTPKCPTTLATSTKTTSTSSTKTTTTPCSTPTPTCHLIKLGFFNICL